MFYGVRFLLDSKNMGLDFSKKCNYRGRLVSGVER